MRKLERDMLQTHRDLWIATFFFFLNATAEQVSMKIRNLLFKLLPFIL